MMHNDKIENKKQRKKKKKKKKKASNLEVEETAKSVHMYREV